MRSMLSAVVLLAFVAGGCGKAAKNEAEQSSPPPLSSPAGANAPANQVEIGEFVIAEPIRHKNLEVFPVLSKTPKLEDRFITLGEGLKSGKVEICEVGADDLRRESAPPPPRASLPPFFDDEDERAESDPFADSPDDDAAPRPLNAFSFAANEEYETFDAEVNSLKVVNRGDKPLYLMPGEVIYGGQQDRAVAEEMIVSADGKAAIIKVYCVEQGRWDARDTAQTLSAVAQLAESDKNAPDPAAREKLAAEAQRGKFVAQAGSLGKGGRMAAQDQAGQEKVWSEVGQTLEATGAATASNAFTANYLSPEVLGRIESYLHELESPISRRDNVVGIIVAIDGKFESVDVFQSTPLFRKLWPVLLKSHALDAAAAATAADADKEAAKTPPAKPSTLAAARQFIESVMQADVAKTATTPGGLAITKRESRDVMSFSTGEGRAMGMGGAMGGFGDAVHSSGFSK